ncbi:DoxX family protein [Novosphingobium cyanobacteriorum]|uniref:DoxX family protein n=1 Tax=Novosphingobium cyanobacteriorum TaxID=3024215 RepID=A0ABT6CIP3_9SPHN|nr:DoxX family protein [Novosphingobium cyanobacteriorum]MDF8333785.1 DoxX family protein [Novosphingobium cyanobacteriorum]
MLALPLTALFAFVGWYKAFAPIPELAEHHAWTVWLPEGLGRLVGWSEMACALVLPGVVHPRTRAFAAGGAMILVANQMIAAVFHIRHAELASLPQNAVITALAAGVIFFSRTRAREI